MCLCFFEQLFRLIQSVVRFFFQSIVVIDDFLPLLCCLLMDRNDNIILFRNGVIACGKLCLSILELLLQLLQPSFDSAICSLTVSSVSLALSSSFTLSNMLYLLFHPDKTVIS